MRTPAFVLALLAAACVSAGEPVRRETASLAGPWGGPMVALEIGDGGAMIREPCGEIALDAIRPDAGGRFSAPGRMTTYTPGPQRADDAPSTTPVAVTGRIEGETMMLSIAQPGAPVRELTLHKGRRAKVIRCY